MNGKLISCFTFSESNVFRHWAFYIRKRWYNRRDLNLRLAGHEGRPDWNVPNSLILLNKMSFLLPDPPTSVSRKVKVNLSADFKLRFGEASINLKCAAYFYIGACTSVCVWVWVGGLKSVL